MNADEPNLDSHHSLPRLSVNIDHIATLRQVRSAPYPDPLEAARIALAAGASGITVHLREDRRHIQDEDVERLCSELDTRINLEMAATESMVRFARRVKPAQVTVVPERPDEITTEGGLDLRTHHSRIHRVATTLEEDGIAVSLFLDPEVEVLDAMTEMRDSGVDLAGFEINTDHFTKLFLRDEQPALDQAFDAIERATEIGRERGFAVFAGHGLTVDNVGRIAAIDGIEELNIGHALISRAALIGLAAATTEMLAAIRASGTR
jgi:pyridoxine 5-phosphate synthase